MRTTLRKARDVLASRMTTTTTTTTTTCCASATTSSSSSSSSSSSKRVATTPRTTTTTTTTTRTLFSSSSSSSSSSASFSANENVVGNYENENNYAPPEGERFKKVIGFRPSKIASSQGASYVSNPWRLRDATQSGEVNHWENPLQGYISFGSEGKVPKLLEFETREAMEQFCRKRRWTLEIMEKKETEHFTQRGSSIIPGAGKIGTQPKAYGDNFSVNRKGLPIWP